MNLPDFKTVSTLLVLFGLVLAANTTQAQVSEVDTVNGLKLTSYVVGSTGQGLPFWLYANRDGKVDRNGTNWITEMDYRGTLWSSDRITFRGGGEVAMRISPEKTLFFPELYLNAGGYGLLLQAGRFAQPLGLGRSRLSSGSLMVSRNATPIPGISLSTPEFVDFPGTDGRVQFKGLFTHKWMEHSRFVKTPYLHQKYAYLRLNIGSVSATGGMIHNVMWGGTSPILGKLPQSFNDYLRVISGKAASPESNAPALDLTNVIGNNIAAYDFELRYESENYAIAATRLFYLEDRVSTRFRSPWDGSWTLQVEFLNREHPLVKTMAYEHINTKRQDSFSYEPEGRARYYNHGTYKSGWTYFTKIIGTPLFLFNKPIRRIINNRIIAHHAGFEGFIIPELSYRLLLTYSKNYGAFGVHGFGLTDKTDRDFFEQFSGLLNLRYRLPGTHRLTALGTLAMDSGELYENTIGFKAGLQLSL